MFEREVKDLGFPVETPYLITEYHWPHFKISITTASLIAMSTRSR